MTEPAGRGRGTKRPLEGGGDSSNEGSAAKRGRGDGGRSGWNRSRGRGGGSDGATAGSSERGGRGGGHSDRGGRGGRGGFGDRGGRGRGFGRGGRGRGRGRGKRDWLDKRELQELPEEEIKRLLAESPLDLDNTKPENKFAELTEESVGVSVYLSDAKGFTGIFKQRYSDFLVNEIDQRGNVVHLTDVKVPEVPQEERTHEIGVKDLKALVGEAMARKFHLYIVKEQEKERLAKQAKEDRRKKWDKFREQKQQEEDAKERDLKQKAAAAAAQKDADGDAAMSASSSNNSSSTAQQAKQPAAPAAAPAADSGDIDVMSLFSANELASGAPAAAAPSTESSSAAAAPAALASEPSEPFLFDPTLDKNQRTALHQLIRKFWPFIETDLFDLSNQNTKTTANLEQKCIRAQFRSQAQARRKAEGVKEQKRGEDNWPSSRPPYLHFVLYKEMKDTMDAITHMCKFSKIPMKLFSYAGTKDKRAVTAQHVTAYKVHAERIYGHIARELKQGFTHIRVGNFSYVKEQLRLGDLKGNRFTIVLRSVDAAESVVEAALQQLSSRGFVNYYGMQRFGTGGVPTHEIGKALLKSDWARAVSLILMPRAQEKEQGRIAREYFRDTRDVEGTLQRMPGFMNVERQVLEGLRDAGANGCLNAIQRLPRNMRLMYVHAYQSFVWNSAVSARLAQFDRRAPVVGDLVLRDRSDSGELSDLKWVEDAGALRFLSSSGPPPQATGDAEGDGDAVMTDGSSSSSSSSASKAGDKADAKNGAPAGKPSKAKVEASLDYLKNKDELKRELSSRVHALTQADIDSGRYTLADVVLPLPGFAVTYPKHMEKLYRDLVASSSGMQLDDFENPKIKDFSLPGSYRKIVEVPGDMKWKHFRYDDPNVPLALTDFDRLEGKPEPHTKADGKSYAVRLEFNLPASTYATMVVRELCKEPTTVQHQRELTERDNRGKERRDRNSDRGGRGGRGRGGAGRGRGGARGGSSSSSSSSLGAQMVDDDHAKATAAAAANSSAAAAPDLGDDSGSLSDDDDEVMDAADHE